MKISDFKVGDQIYTQQIITWDYINRTCETIISMNTEQFMTERGIYKHDPCTNVIKRMHRGVDVIVYKTPEERIDAVTKKEIAAEIQCAHLGFDLEKVSIKELRDLLKHINRIAKKTGATT